MITVVIGKEIEKIKGDFESYLNGLNMVGEISYSQYSKLYDEGVKQIQRAYELGKSELEKENAELKGCETCYAFSICPQKPKRENYTDENKYLIDLECGVWDCKNTVENLWKQLTEAKDLIRNLLRVTYGEGWNYSLDVKVKAEAYLKEGK